MSVSLLFCRDMSAAGLDSAEVGSGSEEGKEDGDPDEWFTSAPHIYGFHEPGALHMGSAQREERMEVDKADVCTAPVCIKQGNDYTHVCIKPMPNGRTGCGRDILMRRSRKLSQLTSGHFMRGGHRNEVPAKSTQIAAKAKVAGATNSLGANSCIVLCNKCNEPLVTGAHRCLLVPARSQV
jgi:hypothetical protein